MISASWDRSRRIRTTAAVLTVISVMAGLLVLALGNGVPEEWWPHTGQAFASSSPPAHHGPCHLTAGRTGASCGRGAARSAPAGHHGVAAAWGLVSVGAGLTALVVWRRGFTRPGRH